MKFFALLLLLSLAFAGCVNNGICSPEEMSLGCSDCSFGPVTCVNDGVCTMQEQAGDCNDCSSVQPTVTTTTETNSNNDLLLIVGGLGLIGFLFFGFFFVVAIGIYFYKMSKKSSGSRPRGGVRL